MTEVEGFAVGFHEALGLVNKTFFQPGPVWAILAYVATIAWLFGLSLMRFCLMRYYVRRRSGKDNWALMAFTLLKWLLIVPGWFMLWFCAMNGAVNNIDICIVVSVLTLAIYVIMSICMYSVGRQNLSAIWDTCMCDDALIAAWRMYLKKYWTE